MSIILINIIIIGKSLSNIIMEEDVKIWLYKNNNTEIYNIIVSNISVFLIILTIVIIIIKKNNINKEKSIRPLCGISRRWNFSSIYNMYSYKTLWKIRENIIEIEKGIIEWLEKRYIIRITEWSLVIKYLNSSILIFIVIIFNIILII